MIDSKHATVIHGELPCFYQHVRQYKLKLANDRNPLNLSHQAKQHQAKQHQVKQHQEPIYETTIR